MSMVESLVATVEADIDLLRIRDGQGDVFAHRRPVDFVFVTDSEPQAAAVAGFLATIGTRIRHSIQSMAGSGSSRPSR